MRACSSAGSSRRRERRAPSSIGNLESIVDAGLRRRLEGAGVPYCLIGAAALAVHGYVRTTSDIHLLTMDERVLDPGFWQGADVTIRKGDWDDPLAGSVLAKAAVPHDVVVGRGHAGRRAVSTAVWRDVLACPVATPLALVLLKLEAGSAQDLYDVVALIETRRAADGAPWEREVADALPQLSQHAREAWERMESLRR